MKLKFELVNGYGVLVDEEAETEYNELVLEILGDGSKKIIKSNHMSSMISNNYGKFQYKIIFAEPELKLEGVPVFEWRDFEVEKLAQKEFSNNTGMSIVARGAFKKGYKSNPAKYTEEDLRKAFNAGSDYEYAKFYDGHIGYSDGRTIKEPNEEQFIQSLQKYPSYIEVDGIIGNKANIVNVIW